MIKGNSQESRAVLKSYLFGISRLKAIIELNQKDTSPPPPSLTYFVDTDVVILYSNPERMAKYVMLFPEQKSDKDLTTSTATLTAELMCSGKLSRQVPGAPLYLLPDHGDEIDSVLRAVIRGASSFPEEDHREDQLTRKLQQAKEQGGLALVADEIAKGFAQKLSEAQRGALAQVVAFNRLFSNDRIARAESLHEMTENVLMPPQSVVNDWIKRLHSSGDPAELRDPHKLELIEHDARALAQLIALNSESDDTRAYVLITGSHRMHRAYSSWYIESAKRTLYLLRHPTHYLPILNASELSKLKGGADSETARSIFHEISQAIDALPLIEARSKRPYPDLMPDIDDAVIRNYEDKAVMQAIEKAASESDPNAEWVKKFSGQWVRLSSLAVSANATILNGRLSDDSAQLIGLLNEGREVFLERQQSVIAELSNRHLAFNIVGKLIKNYKEKQKKGSRPILRFNRITGPLFTDFTEIIGRYSAVEFLDLLDENILSQVKSSLGALQLSFNDVKGAKAALFAACASARIFALEEARALAGRSVEILNRVKARSEDEMAASDLHEARFFKAKLDRFDLTTPQRFESSRAELGLLLDDLIAHDELERSLKSGRVYTERGALGVAAAILCVRSTSVVWHDYMVNLSDIVAYAANDLRRARKLLVPGPAPGATSMVAHYEQIRRLVSRQLHSNIVSHYLLSTLLLSGEIYSSSFSGDEVDQSLAALEPSLPDAPYVVRIEHAIAKWLRERDANPSTADRLAGYAAVLIEQILADHEDISSPEFDRLSFEFYLRRLKNDHPSAFRVPG
ncbi:hypothetical protein [Tahibacter sp.]|uniref:hypothetical protein n=1 Tax=Tahibacter sp. TaxID=2056211 RepID=UPI0028C3EB5C|nr:hypothetical protein [Tahibacter sp.]